MQLESHPDGVEGWKKAFLCWSENFFIQFLTKKNLPLDLPPHHIGVGTWKGYLYMQIWTYHWVSSKKYFCNLTLTLNRVGVNKTWFFNAGLDISFNSWVAFALQVPQYGSFAKLLEAPRGFTKPSLYWGFMKSLEALTSVWKDYNVHMCVWSPICIDAWWRPSKPPRAL